MDGCAAGIKSRVYDFGLYLGYETLELATMGIRAIIDCVVTSRVGDIGGFARKLETMRNDPYERACATIPKPIPAWLSAAPADKDRGGLSAPDHRHPIPHPQKTSGYGRT